MGAGRAIPLERVQLASCVRKRQKRKEVKTMRYEKPEIVRLPDALTAVQKIDKVHPPFDSDPESRTTVNAYEADE